VFQLFITLSFLSRIVVVELKVSCFNFSLHYHFSQFILDITFFILMQFKDAVVVELKVSCFNFSLHYHFSQFILDITFFILMQFKDAVGVNFLNLVVYVFINKYLMSRFLCICRHFLLPDLKFNKF